MLALRLPDEIETRLENLAQQTGRSKSYYAREAIVQHIDELEDLFLAEKELELIRGGARTYSAEEVKKELGLDV